MSKCLEYVILEKEYDGIEKNIAIDAFCAGWIRCKQDNNSKPEDQTIKHVKQMWYIFGVESMPTSVQTFEDARRFRNREIIR